MRKAHFKVIVVVISLFSVLLPVTVKAATTKIVSNTTWTVKDINGTDIGYAQNVCLTASAPTNCPAGATLLGYLPYGWNATIPGATWIWAPGITGESTPAAKAEFTFQTQYYLCCDAENGTIDIAADNYAEVFFDGVKLLTSSKHDKLSTINIPSQYLTQGYHIIKVKVVNWDNPPDCESNQYRCNPAGFIFGALINDTKHDLPKCTSAGKQYDAGYNDLVPCIIEGQSGIKSRLCACISCTYADWVYGTCIKPPTPPCKLTVNAAVPSVCNPMTNTYLLAVKVNYSNAPSG